jgi:hypothetical protein
MPRAQWYTRWRSVEQRWPRVLGVTQDIRARPEAVRRIVVAEGVFSR